MLGGLQGHLGTRQGGEISTALEVLLALTRAHPCQLLQHAHFVGTLLDCLDNFSQAQLHQVQLYTNVPTHTYFAPKWFATVSLIRQWWRMFQDTQPRGSLSFLLCMSSVAVWFA